MEIEQDIQYLRSCETEKENSVTENVTKMKEKSF